MRSADVGSDGTIRSKQPTIQRRQHATQRCVYSVREGGACGGDGGADELEGRGEAQQAQQRLRLERHEEAEEE